MRKYIFLILLASSISFGQSYDRNVLIEVFANSHCGLCPGSHATVDNYLANGTYKDRVNYIYYHMVYPYSDDPLNIANPVDAAARNNYYGPFFSTPRAFFDGQTQNNSYNSWAGILDSRSTQSSPVKIDLSVISSDNNYEITANLDIITSQINSPRAQFVVTENVNYAGRNGISNHKNVMRKMLSSSSGIPFSISSTQSLKQSFTLDNSWAKENLSVIVFVQNSSTKEVYQSASISLNDFTVTDIKENKTIVNNFILYQNFPNPFNPSTQISFNLPKASFVNLGIYNSIGQKVVELENENLDSGIHTLHFNAGSEMVSGIYFYKLTSGNFTQIKKMILIK